MLNPRTFFLIIDIVLLHEGLHVLDRILGGEDERKESEQLLQVILDRGAGHQKIPGRKELQTENRGQTSRT